MANRPHENPARDQLTVEQQILGAQAELTFIARTGHLSGAAKVVNRNLQKTRQHIFDPVLSVKSLQSESSFGRKVPIYNKLYSDLSTESVSILETPLEALFVCLSKISWNDKLKANKRSKLRRICRAISGAECPMELTPTQKRSERDSLELHNLSCIKRIYRQLMGSLC